MGYGTGQHLGKGEELPITILYDWHSIDQDSTECTRLEQNANTLQAGAVSIEETIQTCHMVEIMCIWKGAPNWCSLLIWHADLQEERTAGMIKVTEFAIRHGGGSKHKEFIETWRWFMGTYRLLPDANIMDRIRHRGQEGALDWRRCEITGCNGAIAAGTAMCITCGGLCLFYSKDDGAPYAPTCPEITADLIGTPDCATTIGGAVTVEEVEKVPMKVKAAVGTISNLKVQVKQGMIAKGKEAVKWVYENSYLFCGLIAAEGDYDKVSRNSL